VNSINAPTAGAAPAAKYGKEIQLCFGDEMIGTSYPWSADLNDNTATDYPDAYRRVHNMFIKAVVSNVKSVRRSR
jgi:hypothetical protein